MAPLVQSDEYGANNKTDKLTIGCYVINFVSEAYTLQDYTKCDRQIISASECFFKTQYLSCMQENTNCCWYQKKKKQVNIFPTRTIVHTCLDVVAIKYVHDIPKSIWNRNHTKKALQNRSICMT